MNSKFKITIPKPCHENWNTMTIKEKGRFCGSCSKTVVDFTKKSTTEIQEYLVENKNEQVCGHFYKKQLDSITIEIPQVTFHQHLSFQKTFVLALLFVMGTTLFSCQYSNGDKQKIENVIIKDSIKIIEEDIGLIFPSEKTIDSLRLEKDETIIVGKIEPPSSSIDTLEGELIIEPSWCPSSESEEREVETEDDIVFGIIIEEPPRFKESKNISKENVKEDFENKMRVFVKTNFDDKITECLGLPVGKHKILTHFTIDETGNVVNIKVRAPHSKLEKEATKLLQNLPRFIPGRQKNKPVRTKYTLPIGFTVE